MMARAHCVRRGLGYLVQLCLYLSRFGLSDSRATKALIAVVMLLSLLDDLKVWAIGLLT